MARFAKQRGAPGEKGFWKIPNTLDEVIVAAKEAGEKATRVNEWWKMGRLTHLGFAPPESETKT